VRTNTKFHTLRNFTHHIRPGDRLVKVGTTTDVAAVRGTTDALKSLVHLNKSTEAQQVVLDLSAFAAITSGASVRPVVTDASGALVTGAAVPVRDRAATLTVPARSVTTFVVDGVSGVAQGTGLPGRDYRLTGVQSGKSLTPNGTALVQRDTSTTAADQRWRFDRRTDGFGNRAQFAITNVGTGQRLASSGSGVGLTAPTSDGPNARWVLSTTGDGTWTVVNVATGTLLDVTGESRANGAPIGLYLPTSGDNQRWTAVAAS
jgi:hypothetical protein